MSVEETPQIRIYGNILQFKIKTLKIIPKTKKMVGGALRNQDKTKQEIFIKKDIILQHFLNK